MSEPNPTLLVVEDEAQMRRFLRASLVSSGYQVFEAETGEDGLAQAAARNPDLVLLDLGLPDTDGLAVTERLRQWGKMPIIVLSARGKEEDKIKALDLGADDYLTKPFGIGELLARIRVALRHSARTESGASQFAMGDVKVDLVRRQVQKIDSEVHLTPIEYKLLTTLIKYEGRVITHRQLLKEVWGPNSSEQTQYLRVYMGQLRHKLEDNPSRPRFLTTEPGVGYRLRTEI
ncbi:MAG TPA: response regulator [Polyangiaceae bacterium]|nr:response regulator [Polyangiaceae bacterium]